MPFNSDKDGVECVAPGESGFISNPDSMTCINARAGTERAKVKGVLFGAETRLKSIGISAFESSGMNAIVLLYTVASMLTYAFRDCGSLVSFDTGDGLTRIGFQTLCGCEALKKGTIGTSLSS